MKITSADPTTSPRDPARGVPQWSTRRADTGPDTAALWRATLASALRDPRARLAERDNRRAADRALGAAAYRLDGNLENIELGYRIAL